MGFYVFPAIVCRARWEGLALAAIVVFGYGNPKYWLLALPFWLPVRGTDD